MAPQNYEIRVAGHLSAAWSAWFDGLTIEHEPGEQTVLRGALADQAALFGLLMKVRDLGLVLISVQPCAGAAVQTPPPK